MEKTIERLVNGNIKVTIPIHLKYDGCKNVIHQPEVEHTELDPETMSPPAKSGHTRFSIPGYAEIGQSCDCFRTGTKS
ncbi:MAG: hypothetical protein J6W00_13215 [Lentisphaeria bacterium]|nr:hypothetical protein [Lentisphaeria bacterium]